MKKIKNRKTSIFMRYIFTCSLILLCAVLITLCVFLYYINSTTTAYGEKLQEQCRYVSGTISQKIDALKKQCDIPLHGTAPSYSSDFITQLENSTASNTDTLAYHRSFQAVASLIHISNPNVSTIYSYNSDLSHLIWERSNTAAPPSIDPALWQAQLDQADGSVVFLGSHRLSNNSHVFTAGRALRTVSGAAQIGYFLVTEEMSTLQDLCDTMTILDSQQYYIIDADGTILSARDVSRIGGRFSDSLPDEKFSRLLSQTTVEAKLEDTVQLLSAAPISGASWYVVSFVAKQDVTNDLYHTVVIALGLILAIFTIISCLAAYLFYTSVSIPMNNLIQSIQESGIPLKTADPSNEIGFLRNSYTHLNDMIDGLLFDNYYALLGQKQMEVDFLQAQINPHFLYNTLESIRMMAEIRGDSESAEMTLSLSKILRYSIGSEGYISSIQEELAIIEEYVFLQKMRLDNLESVNINIPGSCYDILVPKLALQPIVENAIIHGLANVQSHGAIDISCVKHDSSITILVADNGEGISEDLLRTLNNKLTGKEKQEFGRIGIQNVNRRLKLLYGDACGIHIESTLGQGTTVYVDLPLQERSKP